MKRTFLLRKIRLKKLSQRITSYDKRGCLLWGWEQVARVLRSDISMGESIGIPGGSDLELSLITGDESGEHPWPFIRYIFENEKTVQRVIESLSFVRRAEDTDELICIRELRIGAFVPPGDKRWELVLWGPERNPLTYIEATLACELAGGSVRAQGRMLRSALVGRIETEPEEVELFGLRRKNHLSHFRIRESMLTSREVEQISDAVAQPVEWISLEGIEVSKTRLPLEDLFHEPGVRVGKMRLRPKALLEGEHRKSTWNDLRPS